MTELLADNMIVRGGVLLIVFAAITAAVFGVWTYLMHRMGVRAELERLKHEQGAVYNVTSLRSQASEGAWDRIAKGIEAAGLHLPDSHNDRLSVQLLAAGYKSPYAPQIYTLVRLIVFIALPAGYLLLSYLVGRWPGQVAMYLVSSLLAVLGLIMPSLFIQARADRRREEILNGFPDCLDLLIICVQSGLGVEASIDRVGREMAFSHPRIAELLSVTTLQLRAGASREEAFRRLAQVAGVDEIRSFTTLIIQSDKLGTSIAATLRVYASEMREMRRLRAEEKAHRLPVLMSIPLVACLLPVMIGVMMLPAAIRLVRNIVPMMLGGG